jgi:hypothetical protein
MCYSKDIRAHALSQFHSLVPVLQTCFPDPNIMDLAALPDDFFVTVSQFTRTTYRDEYPDVDPTSKALSQAGKVVVITGTSQGIGRQVRTFSIQYQTHTSCPNISNPISFFSLYQLSADWPTQGFAPAFAKANAKAIVLVARNQTEVEAAGREIRNINPNVQVLTQALDIRDKKSVEVLYAKIKSDFGTVDVLINNAGSGKSALPIKDVDPEDFWYDFVSNTLQIVPFTISTFSFDGSSVPLDAKLTSSRKSTSRERYS